MDWEALLGMVLGGIMLMIPIIVILTRHQQRMTILLNGGANAPADRLQTDSRILDELAHLRRRMDDLTLALEQVKDDRTSAPPLESRFGA